MKTLDIRMNIVLDDDALEQLKQIVREAISPTREEQARDRRVKASQHANLGGKELTTDRGLLVDVKQAAKLVGVSTRPSQRWRSAGRYRRQFALDMPYGGAMKNFSNGCQRGALSGLHHKVAQSEPLYEISDLLFSDIKQVQMKSPLIVELGAVYGSRKGSCFQVCYHHIIEERIQLVVCQCKQRIQQQFTDLEVRAYTITRRIDRDPQSSHGDRTHKGR